MISRRELLAYGGAAAGAHFIGGAAGAQDAWPSQDMKTICGFPAGSGADIVTRFYAKALADRIGRNVSVENRPGAFGNIAVEAIARAKDGHTIGILPSSAVAAAPALYKTVPFDPVADFDQVTTLIKVPWVLLVAASSPFKTVADLTDHLRKQGDKASYGSVANSGLISSELYKLAFDLKTVEVKYKDPFGMLNDLDGGHIAFAHLDASTTLATIKQGKIRLLATSMQTRASAFPDVPSAAESGIKNSNLFGYWSIAMPKGTAPQIIARLEKIYNEIVATDENKKFVANIGCELFAGTTASAREALVKEVETWREYVRIAKIEKI